MLFFSIKMNWWKKKKSNKPKKRKHKSKKKPKTSKQNLIQKLSDEIILIILTKISQTPLSFNHICSSLSLVSKNLNSLITKLPTISVSFPLKIPLPLSFHHFLHSLPKYPLAHSLHIEFLNQYNHVVPNNPPHFLQWKAVCTPKCQTFVFISADVFQPLQLQQGELDKMVVQVLIPTIYSIEIMGLSAFNSCNEACLWFRMATMAIMQGGPALRRVKITDPDKHGMLCFSDDEPCESRRLLTEKACGVLEFNKIWNVVRLGWVNGLLLPEAGMAMAEMMVGVFRVGEDARVDDEVDGYDEIVGWEFEEGEEVFGEAVRMFFKDKERKLCRYEMVD